MIFNVYSVKDCVSGSFGEPQLAVNDAVSMRGFKAQVAKSPFRDDYQLYRIGEYDTDTGVLCSCVEYLASYSSLVDSEEDV